MIIGCTRRFAPRACKLVQQLLVLCTLHCKIPLDIVDERLCGTLYTIRLSASNKAVYAAAYDSVDWNHYAHTKLTITPGAVASEIYGLTRRHLNTMGGIMALASWMVDMLRGAHEFGNHGSSQRLTHRVDGIELSSFSCLAELHDEPGASRVQLT